ncbi:MAG TPA: SulP family inorganic anion transporter [Acidimicrobiales bacterium]
MAAVSVAIIVVPQAVAYAAIAGLPPITGLYAAAVAPLAGALIGSSPYLQTGPTAITSLLTLGALTAVGDEPDLVGVAAVLALIVGTARVLIGLMRAGVVSNLLSQPAVHGFTFGAALLIAASQVPTIADVSVDGANPLVSGVRALAEAGDWDWASVALGLASAAVILVGRRLATWFPGALAVTVGGLAAVALGYDGSTLGDLPQGLPSLELDLPWDRVVELLVPGIAIAVVGFAEVAAIARPFATADRARWDPDREFVGQGLANLAAGMFGGYPVGGSFGRSALSRLAGARTRWTGALSGLLVLALLPVTEILSDIPVTVLAGVVVAAAISLLDPVSLIRYFRYTRLQFAVAALTLVATLALAPHVERAVVVGVVAAVLAHLWRELPLTVDSWVGGREIHLRPRGVLYFASAPEMERLIGDHLADHPDAVAVVLHLDGLGRIDVSGASALEGIVRDLHRADIEVTVIDVPPQSIKIVRRLLGPDVSVTPNPNPGIR